MSYYDERERTVRDAVQETPRTDRYIAILLARHLIIVSLVILAIIAYVVWRLV